MSFKFNANNVPAILILGGILFGLLGNGLSAAVLIVAGIGLQVMWLRAK